MSGQEAIGQAHGAAAFEERAELLNLRGQADRTATEAAQTLTELVDRLDLARQPRILARRLVADARRTAVRTLREPLGRIARQRGTRAVLAAIPALAVAAAVAVAVTRQRAQPQGPSQRR